MNNFFFIKMFKNFWYIWSKALGERPHKNDDISDRVACIRTAIVLVYIITNFFIVAGIIKHWNN
jgi:hypothetical protein